MKGGVGPPRARTFVYLASSRCIICVSGHYLSQISALLKLQPEGALIKLALRNILSPLKRKDILPCFPPTASFPTLRLLLSLALPVCRGWSRRRTARSAGDIRLSVQIARGSRGKRQRNLTARAIGSLRNGPRALLARVPSQEWGGDGGVFVRHNAGGVGPDGSSRPLSSGPRAAASHSARFSRTRRRAKLRCARRRE